MIETTVRDYLSAHLDVPVKMEVPSSPPVRYVTLEKTGSRRENRLVTSTLAVQSHAESLFEAAKLNEAVCGVMLDIDGLDEVVRVELETDYNYTDTTAKGYRYQALFTVTHY